MTVQPPEIIRPKEAPPGAFEPAQAVPGAVPEPSGAPEEPMGSVERNVRLRELRDLVQDLRSTLNSIRRGEASLTDMASYIERTRQEISLLLKDVRGADAVRRIVNTWNQINASPLIQNPATPLDAQTQLRHLDLLDTQCKRLVFQVGVLTIPDRVNEWLRSSRPGYYIPFHAVFEDELPDLEDRIKVLNYLTWAPNALKGGLVDADSGLIYRYSDDPGRRHRTFLGLVLAFVAAGLFVTLMCYLPIPGWMLSPNDLARTLVSWGAILTGIVVHVGVGTAKRAQARGGRPPIIAVGDIFLLIDARFGQILLKLLLALMGFLGVVFSVGLESASPMNMFLIGYSLDSVVEIFSVSLEQRAGVQVSALKQQLGVEAE